MAQTGSYEVPSTIRMWQYNSTGGIEHSLTLNDKAQPPKTPRYASTQVTIQVLAASLNPIDFKIPELPLIGPYLARSFTTPGLDFSGRVVSAGSDLPQGTLVAGRLAGPGPYGSLSSYLVAPRSGLAKLSDKISPEDGASLGTAGQTAYQSIVPYVKRGDKVFINGGSGGVGTFAVQIAKIIGCHVTTSCSSGNVQLVKDLGADEVIDYKTQDLVTELKRNGLVYDHVFDTVGQPGSLLKDSEGFLKPEGKFIQVGGGMNFESITSMLYKLLVPTFLGGANRSFKFLACMNNPTDMEQLAAWVAEGKLKIIIDSVYPYEEAARAFEKLKTGRARGKVIVAPISS